MKTVQFDARGLKRGNDPVDYFGLGLRKLRKIFLGTLVIGSLLLPLWHKHEQIAPGQQRFTSYISNGESTRPEVILSVTVFFTSGTSFTRDTTLPGWNGAGGWVDCIGGGAAGYYGGVGAGGGGGGGGAAWSRHANLLLTVATCTYGIGAGAAQGSNGGGGATSFYGGTFYAPGGAAPSTVNGGGYSGAGNGNYSNLQGGPAGMGATGVANAGGGGGGGAAGPNAGGAIGAPASTSTGGTGGAGDGGFGGGGGAGAGAGGGSSGGGGNEYGGGGGSGGGGGGGGYQGGGGPGGSYGGGGGGGGLEANFNVRFGGGGYQGIIACLYTPVPVPTVSSCSPNNGSLAGGTTVTITGSGFLTNAVMNYVTFGGVAATSVNVVNNTTITCIAPAHAAGVVNVNVNISNGLADGVGTSKFTYLQPASGFNMPMMGI
jgi:IPT/TIG domain